ncbi:hypothetical protein [Mucilaginibacter xinganensis]|uniref:Uncharacterized protein n=1 Tax=Mucilaginibacter xinganensis TaxID=1234841 RepID=A0A223NXI1_9SPHI|nr:hypothetical protein [Mucilaginibacter xinganensis]ASU34404.1 hypothetical protein MuYL_2517 [Mucilaginibacter xinganensis]
MEINNDVPENFSALDAAELTLKGFPEMKSILKSIHTQAKNGQRCIKLFDMIMPFNIIQELLKKGFILSKQVGMMGEDITVISWS